MKALRLALALFVAVSLLQISMASANASLFRKGTAHCLMFIGKDGQRIWSATNALRIAAGNVTEEMIVGPKTEGFSFKLSLLFSEATSDRTQISKMTSIENEGFSVSYTGPGQMRMTKTKANGDVIEATMSCRVVDDTN